MFINTLCVNNISMKCCKTFSLMRSFNTSCIMPDEIMAFLYELTIINTNTDYADFSPYGVWLYYICSWICVIHQVTFFGAKTPSTEPQQNTTKRSR